MGTGGPVAPEAPDAPDAPDAPESPVVYIISCVDIKFWRAFILDLEMYILYTNIKI